MLYILYIIHVCVYIYIYIYIYICKEAEFPAAIGVLAFVVVGGIAGIAYPRGNHLSSTA